MENFLSNILSMYQNLKTNIDFIKDVIFFCGTYKMICILINYNFNKKTSEIQTNLIKRKELGELLTDYVYEKYKNDANDIAVRFIYWKNYPQKLDDDGYPQYLYYSTYNKTTLPGNFISKTGINFAEHIWNLNKSVYINEKGLYFIADKNKSFKEFVEIKGKTILVFELPFKNIINFDFKDTLEYEPVFYTRCKYNKTTLYSNDIYLRNFDNVNYMNIKLHKGNNIKKIHSIKHLYLTLYYTIRSMILRNKKL